MISDHGCRTILYLALFVKLSFDNALVVGSKASLHVYCKAVPFSMNLCLHLADLNVYTSALPPKIWHSSTDVALSACMLCAQLHELG